MSLSRFIKGRSDDKISTDIRHFTQGVMLNFTGTEVRAITLPEGTATVCFTSGVIGNNVIVSNEPIAGTIEDNDEISAFFIGNESTVNVQGLDTIYMKSISGSSAYVLLSFYANSVSPNAPKPA